MRWPWKQVPRGDALLQALSRPSSRSVRLFGELVDRRQRERKPLLVTTPTGVRPAALAAGDLAAAAMDAGIARLRLIDLRRGAPLAEHLLARPVDISRPSPEHLEGAEMLRQWVSGLVATSGMTIILCAGALDPRHWTEDPAAWSHLEPQTILAVAEGRHTEEQVAEAAERLRRTGQGIVGGILVRRRRALRMAPSKMTPGPIKVQDDEGPQVRKAVG